MHKEKHSLTLLFIYLGFLIILAVSNIITKKSIYDLWYLFLVVSGFCKCLYIVKKDKC